VQAYVMSNTKWRLSSANGILEHTDGSTLAADF
jgi:hypothetical protein